MTNTGALPAKGEDSTPDGSSSRPFVVVVEFSMTFTSTVPATRINRMLAPAAITTTTHAPSRAIGVGPMERSDVVPTIRLTWLRGGVAQPYPFIDTVRPFGRFPVGVWGPPQDANNRQVPKAEMLEALSELDLVCRATPSGGGPEIPYYQVEINKRLPLPFTRSALDVATLRTLADDVTTLLAPAGDTATAFAAAAKFLKTQRHADRAGRIARRAPGAAAAGHADRRHRDADADDDPRDRGAAARQGLRPLHRCADRRGPALRRDGRHRRGSRRRSTTVKGSERAWRTAPPTLARRGSAAQPLDRRAAGAHRHAGAATARNERIARSGTLVGARRACRRPPWRMARRRWSRAPVRRWRRRWPTSTPRWRSARTRARHAPPTPARRWPPAQTVVLKLPNAHADALPDGRAAEARRGRRAGTRRDARPRRPAARRHAARARPSRQHARGAARHRAHRRHRPGRRGAGLAHRPGGLARRAADALCRPCHRHRPGLRGACQRRARSRCTRERLDAGWVSGAELARGTSTLSTTFAGTPRTVVVVLDDPASAGDHARRPPAAARPGRRHRARSTAPAARSRRCCWRWTTAACSPTTSCPRARRRWW